VGRYYPGYSGPRQTSRHWPTSSIRSVLVEGVASGDDAAFDRKERDHDVIAAGGIQVEWQQYVLCFTGGCSVVVRYHLSRRTERIDATQRAEWIEIRVVAGRLTGGIEQVEIPVQQLAVFSDSGKQQHKDYDHQAELNETLSRFRPFVHACMMPAAPVEARPRAIGTVRIHGFDFGRMPLHGIIIPIMAP